MPTNKFIDPRAVALRHHEVNAMHEPDVARYLAVADQRLA